MEKRLALRIMKHSREKNYSSFGETFRNFREGLGMSVRELSDLSKIQIRHLENLEREKFIELPPLVYTRGFLYKCSGIFTNGDILSNAKNKKKLKESGNCDLSREECFIALLRLYSAGKRVYESANFGAGNSRDFPNSVEKNSNNSIYTINSKHRGFLPSALITPKGILYFATSFFLVVVAGYLAVRFIPFVFIPQVIVEKPVSENVIVNSSSITFEGRAKWTSSLTLDNSEVYIGEKGEFKADINLEEGVNIAIFRARNIFGKGVEVARRIVYIKS